MKPLEFFRLLDGDKKLSLTNIAVFVILVKICFMTNFDLSGAAALLTALGAYNFKRYFTRKSAPIAAAGGASELDLAEIRNDVNKIKLAMGFGHGKADSSSN